MVLGYDEKGLRSPMGFRPHDRARASDKNVLGDLYIARRGVMGDSKDLKPLYDIMHRIYRSILIPKVGNQDQIHGYLVDLMLPTHTKKGQGVPLDVPNYLWNEIFYVVMNRKVPTIASYIMAFLNAKWVERRPEEPLTSPSNLVVHESKKLKRKKHAEPGVTRDEDEVLADLSNFDFELPARRKLS